MTRLIFAICALLMAGTVPALADMFNIGPVQIRATAPGMAATGGYVSITNNSHADDRLVAASAGFAKRVEIHEMIHDNGVMKMRQRDGGVHIPAGETVTLKPGGLHIMFMGLGETMAPGEMREVTLEFASGHVMTVPAMVLKPADIAIEAGHGDSHDHSHGGHTHSAGYSGEHDAGQSAN